MHPLGGRRGRGGGQETALDRLGSKTTTLRPVAVILAPGLKWKAARITTQDGTEVFRFDAVTSRAALPPGDYIVEVDGNKIPFAATEGEVLELKPQ